MAKESIKLIFTDWCTPDDQWVFYEENTFYKLEQMDEALMHAKTWGEFRSMLPDGEFEKQGSWVTNDNEQIYWDGENYLFIDPSELTKYLQEIKGLEDELIIKHSDEFDNSGLLDLEYPYHENEIWMKFPKGFIDRFQTGTTWQLSKPCFSEGKFDEMAAVLSKRGYSARQR